VGDHLPLPGLKPVGGEPLMSVMCGLRNAKPTVIFSAARHHRPLAGTKLYCLVTEEHVLTTCPRLHSTAGRPGFKLVTCWSQVQRHSHTKRTSRHRNKSCSHNYQTYVHHKQCAYKVNIKVVPNSIHALGLIPVCIGSQPAARLWTACLAQPFLPQATMLGL